MSDFIKMSTILELLKIIRSIRLNVESGYLNFDLRTTLDITVNHIYKLSEGLKCNNLGNLSKNIHEIKKNKNLNFDIEVDGGINFDNSKIVRDAGANILVSGTTIFKENKGDIKKNIDSLRSS